jgi:hypothetical protein
MNLSELTSAVRVFRQAIAWYQKKHPDKVFVSDPLRLDSKFPHDCCKSASLMLGHHLSHNGFTDIHYVWGYRGEVQHGWLQVNGVIIDITADQFEDEDRPVIMACVGNSSFHASIDDKKKSTCKPQRLHSETASSIITEYAARVLDSKDESLKTNLTVRPKPS